MTQSLLFKIPYLPSDYPINHYVPQVVEIFKVIKCLPTVLGLCPWTLTFVCSGELSEKQLSKLWTVVRANSDCPNKHNPMGKGVALTIRGDVQTLAPHTIYYLKFFVGPTSLQFL